MGLYKSNVVKKNQEERFRTKDSGVKRSRIKIKKCWFVNFICGDLNFSYHYYFLTSDLLTGTLKYFFIKPDAVLVSARKRTVDCIKMVQADS
jgi:hypothetical protein